MLSLGPSLLFHPRKGHFFFFLNHKRQAEFSFVIYVTVLNYIDSFANVKAISYYQDKANLIIIYLQRVGFILLVFV